MAEEEEKCVEIEFLDIPGITKEFVNCGAGIVVPPEPPPPSSGRCRKIIAYEKPDNKLFGQQMNPYFNQTYIGQETLMKYYEPSLPDDLWGAPLFGFYIPVEARRGDKIYILGSIITGTPKKGNTVYWASPLGGPPPGFYHNTTIYIQLGSVFVSDLWSPREEMRHMGPNTFLYYCPQFWRSKSSINLISWEPFHAEICLVNQVANFPLYSQLTASTPHWFPMNATFFPSPDFGLYQNQTTTLVLREVFTEGGYACYPYSPVNFFTYEGYELSPADILGWTRPEDPEIPPEVIS